MCLYVCVCLQSYRSMLVSVCVMVFFKYLEDVNVSVNFTVNVHSSLRENPSSQSS